MISILTTIELNLLGLASVVGLRLICRRWQIPRPPLVMPLLAALVVPWLFQSQSMPINALSGDLKAWLGAVNKLIGGYAAIRIAGWLALDIPPRMGWWKATPKILGDLGMASLCIALTLIVIHQDLQINLIGLAATSAVLTAVLGLAGQATLKDIFAGIALQVDAPFQEGDWIDLDFAQGVVLSLRLMSTRLSTIDGAQIVVPNSRVTSEGLRRFRPNEPIGQSFELALAHDYPAGQAIQLLEDLLHRNEHVRSQPTPKAWVVRSSEMGLVYRLQYWQNRIGTLAEYELRSQLMEQAWYTLHRAGQRLPYPGLTLQKAHATQQRNSQRLSLEQCASVLGNSPLFDHLTASQRYALAELTRCLVYAEGELVMRQGDAGDVLYVVIQGRLAVTQTQPDGPSILVDTLEAGDVFGEMAVFTGAPRSASIQCLEESWLLEVERSDLLPVIQQDPFVLERFSQLIAKRERELAKLSDQHQDSAEHGALRTKIKQLFEGLLNNKRGA